MQVMCFCCAFCLAAAETRSTRLMSQLVEERGRLVDAVIEQANSSTPQLAAELAKSLEVGGAEGRGWLCYQLVLFGIACMPACLGCLCLRAYLVHALPVIGSAQHVQLAAAACSCPAG
jgi:hypothetical protein